MGDEYSRRVTAAYLELYLFDCEQLHVVFILGECLILHVFTVVLSLIL